MGGTVHSLFLEQTPEVQDQAGQGEGLSLQEVACFSLLTALEIIKTHLFQYVGQNIT